MRIYHFITILLVSFALCFSTAFDHAVEQPLPYLEGRITDRANLFSQQERTELRQLLKKVEEDRDGLQIAVLTIPSLHGENIGHYALRVANTWQLGKKGKDNGVLILIAEKERQVQISVGKGLEGTLTDSRSGRIIDNTIVPHLEKNAYYKGIYAGIQVIALSVDSNGQPSFYASVSDFLLSTLFFFIFFLSFFVKFFSLSEQWDTTLYRCLLGVFLTLASFVLTSKMLVSIHIPTSTFLLSASTITAFLFGYFFAGTEYGYVYTQRWDWTYSNGKWVKQSLSWKYEYRDGKWIETATPTLPACRDEENPVFYYQGKTNLSKKSRIGFGSGKGGFRGGGGGFGGGGASGRF